MPPRAMKQPYVTIVILMAIALGIVIIYCLYNYFYNKRSAIVIVEPRKHKDLELVIKNFDKHIPAEWDLYVFHGASAYEFAHNATSSIQKRNVYLKALDVDNLDADAYNYLFKQTAFWDKVNAENILVFQTDTALCGSSPFNITKFTHYNYIGCNIDKTSVGTQHSLHYWKSPMYGVGGLSFRKKSFMMKCIQKNKKPDTYAEDVFFSECAHETDSKPESVNVLHSFCSQAAFMMPSFGAHKTTLLEEEHKKPFYEYCPEASYMKH
jgi:hypothetical protein